MTVEPAPTTEQSPSLSITKLVPASVKEVWPTEPQHFTPWLLANAGELSEVLGLQVELDQREHKVGNYSLDLIGRVSGSEQVVIVENQYGDTDHRHLGQILTYAGGTDPTVIVWIAETFREEHRAALDWLNQNTHTDVRFFGVQLAAVRMAGAPAHLVAPRLELVCKPNDWEKLAKQVQLVDENGNPGVSPVQALYKQFWELFIAQAKSRGWTNATAPAQNWLSMPTGTSSVTWGVSYSSFGCRSELYFGQPDSLVNTYRLHLLEQKAATIRDAFGASDELLFEYLPGKVATRLDVRREGPKITHERDWDDVVSWMLDTQERLRAAVAAAGGVPTAMPPPGWEPPASDEA